MSENSDDRIFYEQIAVAMAKATGKLRWFFTPADFKIVRQLRHSGTDLRCILKAIQQASNMPSCQPGALTLQFVCNFQRVSNYQKLLARSREGFAEESISQEPQAVDLAVHLFNLASQLRSAADFCSHSMLQHVLLSAAAAVDGIKVTDSYTRIEEQISEIGTAVDQQLMELLNEQERDNFYTASQAALNDFRLRVSPHVRNEMLNKSMLKMARKKYNVPRLSLF